ncbi:MAG: tRNA pseudouridine(38-40) synthase TruA [Desulfopila sp.]|jgi:tRNA pseudouridine38-40 synthase|nr:tRNA pseudouridine(38-40) synthase TruA [Desulfopila sp.]
MKTIRLLIAYDGTTFHGWQIQPNTPTIQGEIEYCLSIIHNRHITLHGAGRTDAGVHANGMVAHFHSEKTMDPGAFKAGLNSMLPESIRILQASEESPSFHARFSVTSKTYVYSIYNGEILLPQKRLYTVHIRKQLDFDTMKQCLKELVGTHDFASFETAGSRDPLFPSRKGSTRTIHEAYICEIGGDFHSFTFTGDGFLRHMVRNIVGTVLEVGLGSRTVDDFKAALTARKRSAAGPTSPARGLTLERIVY